MRTRVRHWRVRHWRGGPNPLRRRSDVVEAWTVLAVAVLLLVGAPLLGALTTWWAHDQARAMERAQLADRHMVRAVVTGPVSSPDAPSSVYAGERRSYRAAVRWSEPGGASRTATAPVPLDTRRGERIDVWLDREGRWVPPPVDDAAVWQHAVSFGACSAGGFTAVVLGAHWVVRRVALRHRLAEWEEAWARTEPRWTHRRA